MKVQCHYCKTVFSTPDEYRDKRINCKYCQKSLVAAPFVKPPIVIPKNLPAKVNFITKLWTKSPKAYRTGFLATLGAISAFFLAWYLVGIGGWLKQPIANQPTYKPSISTKTTSSNASSTASKLTADNVYALVMLFHYGKGLETLQRVRASLCTSAISDINTLKALPVIIEPIVTQLNDDMASLRSMDMPHDLRLTEPSFRQVQVVYIKAMSAEIEVMDELILATKTGIIPDNWPQLIDRTTDLSLDASFKLVSLMFQMDSNIAEAVSGQKK